MKRGDIITVAIRGDKPRPAVIIQADALSDSDTTLVCTFTSDQRPAVIRRIPVIPRPGNGLRQPSQIMTEKIFAIRREKCGPAIGVIDRDTMRLLEIALAFTIGLAEP